MPVPVVRREGTNRGWLAADGDAALHERFGQCTGTQPMVAVQLPDQGRDSVHVIVRCCRDIQNRDARVRAITPRGYFLDLLLADGLVPRVEPRVEDWLEERVMHHDAA